MGWHILVNFIHWLNTIREDDRSPELALMQEMDGKVPEVSNGIRFRLTADSAVSHDRIYAVALLRRRLKDRTISVEDMLRFFFKFEVSDPRDKILWAAWHVSIGGGR